MKEKNQMRVKEKVHTKRKWMREGGREDYPVPQGMSEDGGEKERDGEMRSLLR